MRQSLLSSLVFVVFTLLVPASALADTATCLVSPSANVSVADTASVADVLCHCLRAQGVAIGEPTIKNESGEAYRVRLNRLGKSMVLTLSREDGQGQILQSEQIAVNSLEGVLKAAPRLAESLARKVGVASTSTLEPITTEDDKKGGEFLYGASVEGLALTYPFGTAAGLGLHLAYEMPGASINGSTSFHYSEGRESDLSSVNASVGGRKFFGLSNTALFAGGGLAWSRYYFDEELRGGSRVIDGSGVEGFGEVGVEMFRKYESRLLVNLKVSLPFYTFDEVKHGESNETIRTTSRYAVPVTLGTTILW